MATGEPPQIDSSLVPIRAAIEMVADGSAERVTVYSLGTERLLPAARVLARAAGVAVETARQVDPDHDVVVVLEPRSTA